VSFADPATDFLGNGKGGVIHLQLDTPVPDQSVVVDFSVAGTDSSGNTTSTSYEVSFAPGDTFLHTPVLLPAVQQGDQETYSISIDTVTNADIGTPSTASITVFADTTPTITNPGSQVNQHGDQVSLPIAANDPNFLPLTFNADGLPTGLTIDPATGIISGTLVSGTPGANPVFVTVGIDNGQGGTASTTFQWTVDPSTLHVSSEPFNAQQSQDSSGVVALFSDDVPGRNLSDYSATIDWGDGTAPSAGTITASSPGPGYVVTGDHTYAEWGSNTVTVTVSDPDATVSNGAIAAVTEAHIDASGDDLAPDPGAYIDNQEVATFTDPVPGTTAASYTAVVDWGDGSAPTSGTVTGNSFDGFSVEAGGHTYAEAGDYILVTTITANDGRLGVAASTVTVQDGGGLGGGGGFGASVLSGGGGGGPIHVNFESDNYYTFEGSAFSVTIMADQTIPQGTTIPVIYWTRNTGTASSGQDYDSIAPTTVSLTNAAPTATFYVQTHKELVKDAPKTIPMGLTVTSAAATGINSSTLEDDDQAPPAIKITPASGMVVEGQSLTYNVSIQGAVTKPVSFQVATVDGTAHAGTDYTAVSQPIRFDPIPNPGPNSYTCQVTVPTTANATAQASRTLGLQITSPVNVNPPPPNPPSSNPATGTIQYPGTALPVVGFTPTSYSVSESAPYVLLTVGLSQVADHTVTVNYATYDGPGPQPAVAGYDYVSIGGTLTFLSGQFQQTVSVSLLDDGIAQPFARVFSVVLSSPSGGTLDPSATTGIVNIIDADAGGLLSVSFAATCTTVNETDGPANIAVQLSRAAPSAMSLAYTFTSYPSLTAVVGTDFGGGTGSVSFPKGSTSSNISIPIYDDGLPGPDKTFSIQLQQPSLTNTISTLVVIHDNDAAVPTITLDSPTVVEGSGPAVGNVTLSHPYALQIPLTFETVEVGSAISPLNYQAVKTPLLFNPNDTTKSFSVTINEDHHADPTLVVPTKVINPEYQNLVYQVFSDLLVRAADAGGASYWTSYLDNNLVNAAPMVHSILMSTEGLQLIIRGIYQRFVLSRCRFRRALLVDRPDSDQHEEVRGFGGHAARQPRVLQWSNPFRLHAER
jgi:hypothetical protein